jgi:serine/threonine protein kinase
MLFSFADERLSDIVGSAYYVAPEVLHRSYSTEADMWSIGVIAYILLCGSRPFWARTESGIFRSVLRADPNFDDSPWRSVSPEAKDFVKRLLNKDYRKRMTAAQALCKYSHCRVFFSHCNMLTYGLHLTFFLEISKFMQVISYSACLNVVAHPWLRNEQRQIPLDMLMFKLVKAYLRSTPLKQAALKVFFFILYT